MTQKMADAKETGNGLAKRKSPNKVVKICRLCNRVETHATRGVCAVCHVRGLGVHE